ncbi:MAG: hypothetical protein QM651_00980 [Rhodoblastus sp.]
MRAAPTAGAALAVAFVAMAAPSALFATSMRAPYSLLLAAGVIGCVFVVARGVLFGGGAFLRARIDVRRFAACAALAAVLLILGGETHIFRPSTDWYLRDAVLSDLVRGGLTAGYRINETDMMLRAPLGMYVVPALIGRIAGLHAAHAGMLAQNASILAVVFYLLLALGRGWKNLAVVIGFAGVAGLVRLVAWLSSGDLEKLFPGSDTIDSWTPLLQYTGSITQFFWVPNHALAGWLTAILLLLRARREVDTATVGAGVALMMFWSPLAIMPAVPGLLYFAAVDPRGTFASRRTWIAIPAALACLPVAAYMTAASDTIPRPTIVGDPDFWPTYFAFLPVQLGSVGVVYYLRERIPAEWRGLYWLNVALLVFLPFVSFGEYNDSVMRGSIASLTILAFVFGYTLCGWGAPMRGAQLAGTALVVVAASSGAYEIWRSLSSKTYPINACTVMDVGDASRRATLQTNYIAPLDATLRRLFGAAGPQLVDRSWKTPVGGPRPPQTLVMDTACWNAP